MRIPEGPKDLTPGWLTQALRETGAIQEASVLSFRADALDPQKGITGQLARLSLEYDVDQEGAPRTLIVKSPQRSRSRFGWRGREMLFYREIAPHVSLPVPRCYYADANDEGASVLLLEDLAPARSGDAIARDDLPKVELAIREIARFHAAWWEDPRLDEMSWLVRLDGAWMERYMERRWDPFMERVGDVLPATIPLERLRKHLGYVTDQLYGHPPRTLCHNDYQVDNLFYATPEGGPPFAVIDWQGLAFGRGVYDVAFYLCRGASVEERRAVEMGLLEAYHSTLVESGVQGYTFEQCVDDYRLSLLSVLARTVSMVVSTLSTIHQQRFVEVSLPRSWAAVSDLDAMDLLPE